MKVRTEAKFSAAHRLLNYAGKCHNLHGHTWRVEVEAAGEVDKKSGMVVDFGLIKQVVMELDHKTILNLLDPLYPALRNFDVEIFICSRGDPTAENLAGDMKQALQHRVPQGVTITKVRVWESETSYAEV